MNCVQLIGRITKDVELRMSQANIPYVTFTLAVNRGYSQSQEADFIQCVAWRSNAENMSKYISRGALIAVNGRIQVRKIDTNNNVRYVTEIVCDNVEFLESKAESEARKARQGYYDSEPIDPLAKYNNNAQQSQPFKQNNIFNSDEQDEDIKTVPSDLDVTF